MHSFTRIALLAALSCLFTSPAGAQDPALSVRQWLLDHHARQGLTRADATAWHITNRSTDKQGITYVYIRQEAHGLPVLGAVANFAVKEGRVVHFGNRLQPDVAGRAGAPSPALRAEDALLAAARQLGLGPVDIKVQERPSTTEAVFSPGGLSRDPVPVRLVYRSSGDGAISLAWSVVIRETSGQHWWHLAVDAQTGELLWKNDWVLHCAPQPGLGQRGYNAVAELTQPATDAPMASRSALDGAGYRVFPLPTESPVFGPHSWVSDPADPVASPYGWHDTDGVPGAEYTITRGNNVYAGEDWADTDIIGHSPDGGSALSFDFPFTPPQDPVDYIDAAITNLFYTCNMLHDIWHHYGFDEESGNFQETNYTGAGQGQDAVLAHAQDGSGTNNANFATPPDGSSGVMQMFLWRTSEGDTFRVNSPSPVAGHYPIETAGFGPTPPSPGITADLVLAQDDEAPQSDGCEDLTNAAALAGKIAVVDRGQCTFVEKVLALQAAGAVAVVVVNNVGGAPITMGGTDPGSITIPSVMVSMANGQAIKNAMQAGPVNATLKGVGGASLRDSDLDNGIIAHEYGHGVSNRLTGGPSNVDCLWNDDQMGEGWSDWMGMVLTMQDGDLPQTGRGVGTFVKDEGPDGPGIRPAPYSTDPAVNAYTYGITNTTAFQGSHARGFVWASMLWELTWDLVALHGFDANMHTGSGGNNIAMRLVMDGMKLQPCEPGFVDGRDAILLADELNFGGAHACLIWEAFARRGLGLSASQGSPYTGNDQSEAFDIPAWCITAVDSDGARLLPTGFVLLPNPATDHVLLGLGQPLAADAEVRLLAVDGRVLHRQPLATGTAELLLDLHGHAPGVYIVQLEAGGTRMQQRLVVE